MKVIYKHFATQRYTAFLAPPPCSSGWMRKHAFMSIFVAGHQRTILTGVLPIAYELLTMYLDNKENINAQHYWPHNIPNCMKEVTWLSYV